MTIGAQSLPTTERLAVHDRSTGAVIAELPIDDADAVAAAAERARAAQPAWAALGARGRAKLLRKARKALVRDRAAIFERLERETGKARFDVVGELMGVVPRPRRPGAPRAALAQARAREHAAAVRQARLRRLSPRGVVGIISPWNAPLNLALGDALPALLAGNAVIIKPSELAPLAVQRACAALNTVLPPDVLQVVIGAGPAGAALVDHVDLICVTGSPETGRRVMERASRRLTPVLLELGGKDPMIVCRDADLDRAAAGAAWGGCMMTGQVCMSVERVYVEAPVAEAFTAKLVERMQALRTGANGPAPRSTSVRSPARASSRSSSAMWPTPSRAAPAAHRRHARRRGRRSASRRRCSPASTTRWRSCARRRSARSCR
jgi:acyl-CoA reductase-like NAD-dependent aldehyde dehydrogenase